MKCDKLIRGLICQALLVVALGTSAESGVEANRKVVTDFVDAFNKHNIEDMLALVTESIRVMYLDGGDISTQADNPDTLREEMRNYFADFPTAASTLSQLVVSNNFVSAVEQASWQHDGQTRRQCSLSVYELENYKIKNVWYYAAHACE